MKEGCRNHREAAARAAILLRVLSASPPEALHPDLRATAPTHLPEVHLLVVGLPVPAVQVRPEAVLRAAAVEVHQAAAGKALIAKAFLALLHINNR